MTNTTYAVRYNENSKKWRVVKQTGPKFTVLKGAFKTQAEAEAAATALRTAAERRERKAFIGEWLSESVTAFRRASRKEVR